MSDDNALERAKIIAALRCCGNTDTKRPNCEHCPLMGPMCVKRMLEGAADLIEELTANMEMFTAYRHVCGGRPPEEIAALVKARVEGRVKVGDRVKVDVRTWGNIWDYKTIDNGKFLVGEVVSITQTKKQLLMKIRVEHNVGWKRPMKRYPVSALGITVFLTRTEAEAALGGVGDG